MGMPNQMTSSGINVDQSGAAKDYGLTATVTLSRAGMGMTQRPKNVPPPSAIQAGQIRSSGASWLCRSNGTTNGTDCAACFGSTGTSACTGTISGTGTGSQERWTKEESSQETNEVKSKHTDKDIC